MRCMPRPLNRGRFGSPASRAERRCGSFVWWWGPADFIETHDLDLTDIPQDFMLEQNFPNPFNPETAIRFGLPQPSVVTLKIFDLVGREIATLLNRVELPMGRHQRMWDGRDAQGSAVMSGIYF